MVDLSVPFNGIFLMSHVSLQTLYKVSEIVNKSLSCDTDTVVVNFFVNHK